MLNSLLALGAWIGLLFLINKIQKMAEDQKKLEEQLVWISAKTRMLTEALCESHLLRGDLKSFAETRYDTHHELLSDHPKAADCICSALDERTGVLDDRISWYANHLRKHPDQYESDPDYIADKNRETLQSNIRRNLVPLFEQLHNLNPKSYPKEHIEWFLRLDMDDSRYSQYCQWLMPQLRKNFSLNKTEQELGILDEIEKKLPECLP